MDKSATSNMTSAETEAWVSMAKDGSLRDALVDKTWSEHGLPKAMQRRMEALRRKREGLSV